MILRPTNQRQFDHAEAVASRVPNALKELAWLHDSVEDGWATLDHIEALTGPAGRATIDALTRRAGETYADYIERLRLDDDAVTIKIADLQENISSPRSPTLLPRYARALLRLTR